MLLFEHNVLLRTQDEDTVSISIHETTANLTKIDLTDVDDSMQNEEKINVLKELKVVCNDLEKKDNESVSEFSIN